MNTVTIVAVAGVVGVFAQWRRNAKEVVTRPNGGGPVTNFTTSINPKFIIATIAVAFGLGLISDVNPKLGSQMSWLYLAGVVLVEGTPLISGIQGVVKK